MGSQFYRLAAGSALVALVTLHVCGSSLAAPARRPAAAPPATPAGPPPPGAHMVKLTNGEAQAVTAVYASAPGKNDWCDDLLGKQTAGPGKTVSLMFMAPTPDTCVQDLQMLMNDGKVVQKAAVNVCETADYQFKQ
jgi:hypothetical protein